jgi:hypothetical protein
VRHWTVPEHVVLACWCVGVLVCWCVVCWCAVV